MDIQILTLDRWKNHPSRKDLSVSAIDTEITNQAVLVEAAILSNWL